MSDPILVTRGTTPATFTVFWPDALTDCSVEVFEPDPVLEDVLTAAISVESNDDDKGEIEVTLTLDDDGWRDFPRNSHFAVRVTYPDNRMVPCKRMLLRAE